MPTRCAADVFSRRVHTIFVPSSSYDSSNKDATRNKCIASSNKCLTSSNNKLLETICKPDARDTQPSLRQTPEKTHQNRRRFGSGFPKLEQTASAGSQPVAGCQEDKTQAKQGHSQVQASFLQWAFPTFSLKQVLRFRRVWWLRRPFPPLPPFVSITLESLMPRRPLRHRLCVDSAPVLQRCCRGGCFPVGLQLCPVVLWFN